jgi:hypothetical protein
VLRTPPSGLRDDRGDLPELPWSSATQGGVNSQIEAPGPPSPNVCKQRRSRDRTRNTDDWWSTHGSDKPAGARVAPSRRGHVRCCKDRVKLKDKVQNSLDEARMLVLGIQVLLGFDLQAFLMSRWDAAPAAVHHVKIVSLCLLLVAFTLVLAPAARHRIVDEGRDTPRLDRFTRRATTMAIVPFAAALGLDFYGVGAIVDGPALGVVLGAITAAFALGAWFLLPWRLRSGEQRSRAAKGWEEAMKSDEQTELNDKIRHVLTEARVVLPGTQALLGFQFAAVLQSGFDSLPASSKLVHVVALVSLGASVIFLMLPAAYHRIAEGGEISERLHRFSGKCLLLAMGTLSVAIAGDTFIVIRKATASAAAASIVGVGWLVFACALWFGLMLVLRHSDRSAQSGRDSTRQHALSRAAGA